MEYNFFTFNIVTTALSIVISLIIGFIVFSHKTKSITSRFFIYFIISTIGWSIVNFLSYQNIPYFSHLFFIRFVMFFATLQALLFYLLMYVFPDNIKVLPKYFKIVIIPSVILVAFLTLTTYVFKDAINYESGISSPVHGVLLPVFGFTAISLVFFGLREIFLKRKRSTGNTKQQIVYITRGVLIMFLLIIIFNFILPVFLSNTSFITLSSFFVLPFLFYTSYAILKFQLFNIKVITTELITFTLWIFILIRTLLANSLSDKLINTALFIIVIVVGILLIKSVRKEVEQREKLEVLTGELSDANEKLKGLDKLKSEFVSLASHQLRSPLTAMKGYTSMLIDGDYGEINLEAKGALNRIFESSQNLMKIVEDLLNVTKIEQGGMKYEMAPFELSEVAGSMTKDLSITANNKGLKLNFKNECEGNTCMVNGDKEKIRQVVLNFIDNSIKYTKEGEINVTVKKLADKVIFSVLDTGMGMTPEIKATLFQKFARGDGARMNTSGSGLGLYLTKEIAEAHGGRVWVESEGLSKGSQFYMELNAI